MHFLSDIFAKIERKKEKKRKRKKKRILRETVCHDEEQKEVNKEARKI